MNSLVLFVIFCASAEGQDTLNAIVEGGFRATKCPGLSVAVAKNNQIIYSKAFGFSDLEQGVAMTNESVHRLASVSKPVSGTILMELVQSRRLTLDDPVRKYLPELPATYDTVTIRHLMDHQAGVRGYRDLEEVFSAVHYKTSREALKAFMNDPLLFEPGIKAEYSTFGFTALGAVAESVTGKSFQELSFDFFRRYGIHGFFIDDALAIVPKHVRGYRIDAEGNAHNARFYDASNKYPAGGFAASAEDGLRFVIAVGLGKVLKPEFLQQTWTPQSTAGGTKTPFGLGWGVSERNGRKMVGFNGLQPTTTTSLRYYPDTGVGIALFCNAETGDDLSALLDRIDSAVWAK